MSKLIELNHVSRFYGTVIGVGDLNLTLERGAYGLVGPNGSGKTTFINLVTGMLTPSIGSVGVLGKDPGADRTVLREIGLCPASEILLPNVSALQWVEYQTALHGYSKNEAYTRAVDSLVQVGMEEGMRRPIGSYSLGMRQRTKLAQAMAHDPELLTSTGNPLSIDRTSVASPLARILPPWINKNEEVTASTSCKI